MLRETFDRLGRDQSGAAQMEYIVVFLFVSIPLCLALVPVALVLLDSYLTTREMVLYGQP